MMPQCQGVRQLVHRRLHLVLCRRLDIDLVDEPGQAGLDAIRVGDRAILRIDLCRLVGGGDAQHLSFRGCERDHHQVILVGSEGGLPFGAQNANDAQRRALDDQHGADRIGILTEELVPDGLTDQHNQRRVVFVGLRYAASEGDLPVRYGRIVRRDSLNAGGPVLVAVQDLSRLADQVAHLAHRLVVPLDCVGIGDGQGRGASRPAARASRA